MYNKDMANSVEIVLLFVLFLIIMSCYRLIMHISSFITQQLGWLARFYFRRRRKFTVVVLLHDDDVKELALESWPGWLFLLSSLFAFSDDESERIYSTIVSFCFVLSLL